MPVTETQSRTRVSRKCFAWHGMFQLEWCSRSHHPGMRMKKKPKNAPFVLRPSLSEFTHSSYLPPRPSPHPSTHPPPCLLSYVLFDFPRVLDLPDSVSLIHPLASFTPASVWGSFGRRLGWLMRSIDAFRALRSNMCVWEMVMADLVLTSFCAVGALDP